MKQLKELRRKNTYTQEELASLIHIKRNTLCDWELNKTEPNIENLIKLANIFQITVDYLVENELEAPVTSFEEYQLLEFLFGLTKEKQENFLKIVDLIIELKGDESLC